MRYEIEKRLHRVKINLDKKDINCPYVRNCDKAANCERCNTYFKKCTLFRDRKLSELDAY